MYFNIDEGIIKTNLPFSSFPFYFEADCECLIWTESHFRTFDRLSFTFNGGCSYILVKSYGITGDMPAFILTGTFQSNDQSDSYSLSAIRLEYLGFHYEVWRNGSFYVDDEDRNVPFGDGKVSVSSLIDGNSVNKFVCIFICSR